MRSERLISFPNLLLFWERRIGLRLDMSCRAFDPGMENNSHLLPNDHLTAQSVFALICKYGLVTAYRSLVWPFTPMVRFSGWVSASHQQGVL